MSKKKKTAPTILESINITLPTTWGQLTSAQVSKVCELQSRLWSETEFFIHLAEYLAGLVPLGEARIDETGEMQYLYLHRPHGNITLTAEHITAIIKALEWINTTVDPMCAPLLDGYPTPNDRFYDVSLEQYITANQAYAAYMRSMEAGEPNTEALRMMVAALYPLKGFDGDRLRGEANRLSYKPQWELEAVVLWFTGNKRFLSEKYPLVFQPSDGFDDGPATPGDEVMLGMLSALNGGDITLNEKLLCTNVHDALFELNRKIKEVQDAKRRVNKK